MNWKGRQKPWKKNGFRLPAWRDRLFQTKKVKHYVPNLVWVGINTENTEQQLDDLSKMTWKENQIRLFLFGDCDFLLKVFSISGSQSAHPFLWCTASKIQIQTAPNQQPHIPHRTLANIKADYRKFKRRGRKEKRLARAFGNNVCHAPMFDTDPTQVSPPPPPSPSHHAGYR